MGALLERLKRSSAGRFYAKYSADRADEGAMVIAWQALFSLFPLLLGLLAIFGLLLRDPERRGSIAGAIASQFPGQVADLLSFMEETRELGGLLGAISVIGLLWSGSTLFGTIAQVFNRFYGAPDRGFLGQTLMALTMMVLYIVLTLVSVLSSGAATFLVGASEHILPVRIPGSAYLAGWLIGLGAAVLMFLALYRVVPNAQLSLADVWRGAVLAGALFVILNQSFPLYLRFFGGGFENYKTLGLFLLLMTWFYFMARILVLGAELNAFLTGHGVKAPAAAAKTSRFSTCSSLDAAGASHRATAPDGNGEGKQAGKQILWAALTAGVTGITIAAVHQTAAAVWRGIMREEPPE